MVIKTLTSTGRSAKRLASRTDEEAEDLRLVGISMIDWEGKVQCDWSLTQCWHLDAKTETWGNIEVVPDDLGRFFDRTNVGEDHTLDHVVGRDWELVFHRP